MNGLTDVVLIDLGVAIVGWLLSLGWYQTAQQDALDRDTVLFFAKLWLGMGAFGVAMFLLFKL